MTYSEKLQQPDWKAKRKEILNTDNYTCQYCRDKLKVLDVHHLVYNNVTYNPCDVPNSVLISLCRDCHTVHHLKDITDNERELIHEVHFSAFAHNGSSKLMNILVKQINSIYLNK